MGNLTNSLHQKHSRTVVVVDDEPEILEFYTFLFGDSFKVISFSSPVSFLESLDSDKIGPIAFVVSDYMMPGMNGVDLIREINHRGHNIPFLLVSGYINKEVALAAVNNNCQRIIEKPAAPSDILAAAKDLLKEQEIFSVQKRMLEISEQLKELYVLYREIVTSNPESAQISSSNNSPDSPLSLIAKLETELDFLVEKAERLAA